MTDTIAMMNLTASLRRMHIRGLICSVLLASQVKAVLATGADPSLAPPIEVQPAVTAKASATTSGSTGRGSAGNPQNVEIVRQFARRRGGRPDALAQLIQMAAEFDDATAASLLGELATAHVAAGELDLAAETRQMIVLQYPEQPLAAASMLWHVRSYASGEIAHARRARSEGAENIRRQLSPAMRAALQEPAAPAGEPPGPTAINRRSDAGATYALHVASQAATTQPLLSNDAAFMFQRSVAARRAGQDHAAQALLTPLKHRAAGDPWGDAARAEAWLQQPERGPSPKPVVNCVRAESRPHLDGVLDEDCWQTAASEAPRNATDVRWAYDDGFLYFAVRCDQRPGVSYPRDDRPRPHDGDVASYDHVRLAIDLDRDYATWFELTVDSRGWTADRCAGDASWNPQWFVAAAEDNLSGQPSWIVEAAIPLAELTDQPLTASTAWAWAATRILSRSESDAAQELAPQDCTLLLFARPASPTPPH